VPSAAPVPSACAEDERVAALAVERQRADAARLNDARQRRDPLDELLPPLQEVGPDVAGDARDVELHGHGEDLPRVEAGVRAAELEEAARHEAGADDEDDGDRHLGDDQRVAQPAPPPAVPRVRRRPCDSASDARSAGSTPKSSEAATVSSAAKPITRASVRTSSTRGSVSALSASSVCTPHQASARPASAADQAEHEALGQQLADDPDRVRRRGRRASQARAPVRPPARAAGSRGSRRQ
jgi:hypothetical protein